MAILFSILVTIVILGWLWFYIARPILEDYGVLPPITVNTYQPVDRLPSRVMSREEGQTEQTDQTDEQTDRVSEPNNQPSRLQLDKTRAALIEELLYNGWTLTDIRRERILRGDNGEIGTEIEAARKRLGIAQSAQYVTPIAGRPTKAVFESDPELAYQPPE